MVLMEVEMVSGAVAADDDVDDDDDGGDDGVRHSQNCLQTLSS